MLKRIITIGRQFGSGGKEIGEKVAKALEIPCYDRSLIELASRELNIDTFDLEQMDEKAPNPLLARLRIPFDQPDDTIGYSLPVDEQMQLAQEKIIRELSQRSDCVMIGRCADYILRDNPRCLSIFICADREDRIRRICSRYQLAEKEAVAAIKKVDKKRQAYYEAYTNWNWGSMHTHQVIINISQLGSERTSTIIKAMYRDI